MLVLRSEKSPHGNITRKSVYYIFFEYCTMSRTLMSAQQNNNNCHLQQVMIFIIKVKSRQFN